MKVLYMKSMETKVSLSEVLLAISSFYLPIKVQLNQIDIWCDHSSPLEHHQFSLLHLCTVFQGYCLADCSQHLRELATVLLWICAELFLFI